MLQLKGYRHLCGIFTKDTILPFEFAAARKPTSHSSPAAQAGGVLALLVLLAGCAKPAPQSEPPRPVRAATVTAGGTAAVTELGGDVRARYESRLGFRVGGKISARKVEVGTRVRRGQLLMQLDPQDLRLAQTGAQANLRAAETASELAQAEFKRYQDLRSQNFVSEAVLDQKRSAARAGAANVEAARAQLRAQANQAGYAELAADGDGVVTAIGAEAGQVVQAGTPVVTVDRTDEMEVVVGVPEDQVGALRQGTDVQVRLWSDPDRAIAGRIREIAPVADPATRTYAMKVALPPQAPGQEAIRLGMTAVVRLAGKGGLAGKAGKTVDSRVHLPLSALVQSHGASAVWLVDQGAVHLAPVTLAGVDGNDVMVAGGVAPGQTVVTAGVHLLKEGQKVSILGADVAQRGDAERAAVGLPAAGPRP